MSKIINPFVGVDMEEINTIKFEDSNYFSRAWRLVTDGKDIFKVLLLLTLILFIPVVGPLWMLGYILEWARLTAWGVESYPKTSNMQPGKCIATGFKASVVGLGWIFIIRLVVGAIDDIGGSFIILSDITYLINAVIQIVALCFVSAVMLRATIYQNISEGYNFKEIYNLFVKDWKGFLKIVGIQILIGLAYLIFTSMILTITLVGVISTSFIGLSVTDMDVPGLVSLMSGISGSSILVFFLLVLGSVFTSILIFNMLGLWMLQFNEGCKQETITEEAVVNEETTVEENISEEDTDTRKVPELLYGTKPAKVEKRYHKERLIREAPKGLYDVEVGKVERRYHEDEE